VDNARLAGDVPSQLLISSGLYLLSHQSRPADRSIDLGLTGAQLAVTDPLRNPAIHTVFARDSVIGRRAVSKKYSTEQKLAEFDPDKAQQLALLNSIAYCANLSDVAAWNCTRCSQIPGFQPHLVHFDESWDLLGYVGYWPALNAKVLVFRGTDSSSWYNWAENMRAWRTDATYPVPGAPKSLRIHSGFLILWNSSSLASTFHEAFGQLMQQHPSGPTYVLGHSMGGALAQLAALDIKIMYKLPDVKVYTFGSPRVGNSVFEQFFASLMTESWRFTHGRDIVPSVPPQLFGFHHVSREVWLVDVASGDGIIEQQLIVCDDSGEDPTCHNSACRLGLCTSVADHLLYLGAHMYRGGEC
jgi:predicted lipase